MNDFDQALEDLKNELFSLEEVKTYFKLKSEIDNNAELVLIKEKITSLKQEMTLNIDLDDKYFKAKKEYELLLKKYTEHPLIQNFEIVKENVYNILMEIKKIIEK